MCSAVQGLSLKYDTLAYGTNFSTAFLSYKINPEYNEYLSETDIHVHNYNFDTLAQDAIINTLNIKRNIK